MSPSLKCANSRELYASDARTPPHSPPTAHVSDEMQMSARSLPSRRGWPKTLFGFNLLGVVVHSLLEEGEWIQDADEEHVTSSDERRRFAGTAASSRSRAPAAVAVIVALLVAAGMTAAAAYIVRPSSDTSGTTSPTTLAALAPATTSPHETGTAAPSPSSTPRRIATPRRAATFTPTATATRRATASRTPKPSPTPTPKVAALFLASGQDLASWLGPNWADGAGVLVNDGDAIVGQPWLPAPYEVANGAYAVEAEIRVIGVAREHCEQSFGVVAGGSGGIVWGGSVVFACDGVRRARLTDVTDWSDGYNQDRLLGTAEFDPREGWHAYRLEVDGNRLRFLIDGRTVLETTDDWAVDGTEPGQVGLWSQGVQLEVRRVAVFAA
ncbi:MAG: 3-keto-disaccharide hydrolase [Thermomicrobiales bacterium]|nr:3-keto-disaccharide hydrolase [Thermomicrobiales bacterium]